MSRKSRHRKRSLAVYVLRNTAIAVAGSAVLLTALPVAAHWLAAVPNPADVVWGDAFGGLTGLGLPGSQPQPQVVKVAVAHRPGGYLNPLRGITGLAAERIDEGVDFAGTGPIYPVGDAVVTGASSVNYGWPGGGWITYQLVNGPDAGLVVYVAEDVTPTVKAGQHVTTTTVIGNMWSGYDGIETGWAQTTSLAPESEASQAGGIGGYGPFPTRIGINFDQLLQALGVPAAPNYTQAAYGLLPANYPTP